MKAALVWSGTNIVGSCLIAAGVWQWSPPAALVTFGGLMIVVNFAEALMMKGRR